MTYPSSLMAEKLIDFALSKRSFINIDKYKNVVVIGASIIQNSFGRDLVTPNAAATSYLGVDGVNVYGYGWSGYTIELLMDKISEVFAAFPDNDTLFIVHAGGNNTTATIPYGTAAVSALAAFDTAITNMYSLISSRTNDVIVADLTFRDYNNECVYNQELGSLPFIENLYKPKRLAKWTNTDGNSVIDFYTYIRNNYALALSADRVHMTPAGEYLVMKFPLDRIRYLFNGGSMPAPIVDTIPPYEAPTGGSENNIIINFGSDNLNSADLFTGVKVRALDFVAGNIMPIHDVSGNSTPYSMSFTAEAFAGGAITLGSNVNGVDLGGTFANSLMSNPIHRETLWWSPTDLVKIKFLGFTVGQTVNISFVATRVTGMVRYTEMIDVSNPVNLVAYPTSGSIPPEPVTLTLTANAYGEVEVQFDAKSGTAYTYLGGIQLN